MKKNNFRIYKGKIKKEKFKLTKNNIKRFSIITLDKHPLHTNLAYAKEKGFEDIIVQGLFLSSLAVGQITDKLIGTKTLIIAQDFNYHIPIYVNNEFLISSQIKDINLKFKIALIEVKIIIAKKLHASGNIRVKIQK
tara:strand:+ start:1118 stop:1528 length:411 start_codon:yes stop_codon:yes gene_type:complete